MTSRTIVFVLAFLGCSLSLTAQRMGLDPQSQQSPFSKSNSRPNSRSDNNTISGTVQDMNNKPLKDVRVELRGSSSSPVDSAVTDASGNFQFSMVVAGPYTAVACSGLQQASERVDASVASVVNLRMPANNPTDGTSGNSISVAQYRIPGKARDEYRKAQELLEKRKTDDANKHLAKALELCPNYADALTLRGVVKLNE